VNQPSPLASWNGEIMPLTEVRVPVLDRAFLFGDAIYEALRVYEGRPFLVDEHMARLRRSLDQIRIEADVDRIERRLFELLERHPVRSGLVYLQVTRGVAPRTHYFPANPTEPNELIYVSPLDDDPHARHRETGVDVITFDDLRWKRCDIKSVNLLANCMAAQAAREAGCAEAILVAADGAITEGSHTSVFGVRDGAVMTAPLARNILPGITRSLVVELADRAGIPIREEPLSRDRLSEVDELFLTGTTAEVLPVTRVDDQPIGSGQPGEVTRQIAAAYRGHVADWLAGAPAPAR